MKSTNVIKRIRSRITERALQLPVNTPKQRGLVMAIKVLGVVVVLSDLATHAGMPGQVSAYGTLLNLSASTVKDGLVILGDWLDNQRIDHSFKGDDT